MRIPVSGFFLLAGLALVACSPQTGSGPDHLECAALISAANRLSLSGKVETGPELDRKMPGSLMMHLNSYAIPKKIREPDAMREVEELRDALIGTETPAAILQRAVECIEKTPGQ